MTRALDRVPDQPLPVTASTCSAATSSWTWPARWSASVRWAPGAGWRCSSAGTRVTRWSSRSSRPSSRWPSPSSGRASSPTMGQRVVEGQRLVQSASDIFLGWDTRHRRGRRRPRLLLPPDVGLEALGRHRHHAAGGTGHLRPDVRLGAGPRPRPLGRRHRHRLLPRGRHPVRRGHVPLRRRPTPTRTRRTTTRSSRPSPPTRSTPSATSERTGPVDRCTPLRTSRIASDRRRRVHDSGAHLATAQARIHPRRSARLRLRGQGSPDHPPVTRVPEGRDAGRGRLPGHLRRAAPRRQRPPEPGHLLPDLGGGRGPPAHGPVDRTRT